MRWRWCIGGLAASLRAPLRAIRRPSALLGAAWISAGLPSWAQQLAAPAPAGAALADLGKGLPGEAIGAAATSLAIPEGARSQAVASRLIDSYELCKEGRLGQHELAFLTVFILIGCFIFFLQIDRRLIRHGWEIRKALSEPVSLTSLAADNSGNALLSRDGQVLTQRVLEPSVSRLIALAGLIMLILFYFGFGIISLYHFGRTCEMPGDIGGVTTFLYAGLTFFAPYIVTKFSEAFARKERFLPLPGRADAAAAASQPAPPIEPAGRSDPPPVAVSAAAGSLAGRSVADAPGPLAAQPAAQPQPVIAATAAPLPAPARPAPGAPSQAVHNGASTATKAAPAQASVAPLPLHADALDLIKEFEGFRDKAYPDPASGGEPWTIGYGFTRLDGHAVRQGQTISRAAADQLLIAMLKEAGSTLSQRIPGWDEMHEKQQSCLMSFAWNLGLGFYGDDDNFHTISACLRGRDWARVPDALLLYCMPGTSVHQGLLRRRRAEADLWRQGLANAGHGAPSAPRPTPPSPAAAAPPVAIAARPQPLVQPGHRNPLEVGYFDQMLMDDGQGWRDCFSASCAMLAHYWGKMGNQNIYNHIRQKYGDSTDSNAQISALRSLNLKPSFRTDGTAAMLKAEIDAGRPVAVGWLHHGPVSAPCGGGHWTVVIGYDETGFWMNDPYGSCDLINGGYPGGGNPNDQIGRKDHYSYKNWLPRWRPNGSSGWFLTCQA